MNETWATVFIDTLIEQGCDTFCIAPGSRSTPLTVAIARHSKARTFVHFDERGLGFFALGFAKALQKPVALLTTSGTAVANLLPAVCEAHNNRIPLLVLTADRPHELRETGANQTMRQIGIFSPFVNWEMDMPCPDAQIPLPWLQETLHFALQKTQFPKGVVHLNCPFREPFFDESTSTKRASIQQPLQQTFPPTTPNLDAFLAGIVADENTWILVGQYPLTPTEQATLKRFAEVNHCTVLVDIGAEVASDVAYHRYYDLALGLTDGGFKSPKTVLQIGTRLVSKRLFQFLEKYPPIHYHVFGAGRLQPLHFLESPKHGTKPFPFEGFAEQIQLFFNKKTALTEPLLIHNLSKLLPAESVVFWGNSMPVRYADMLFRPPQQVQSVVQRGVSGIDGLIASACGFAQAKKQLCTLVLGDLSLLHDINSLAWLQKTDFPVIVLVFNNDGGAIFGHLPIAKQKDVFETYFKTPHGFSFEHAAALFHLPYFQPQSVSAFRSMYQIAIQSKKSALIEIKTDAQKDQALLAELKDFLHDFMLSQ